MWKTIYIIQSRYILKCIYFKHKYIIFVYNKYGTTESYIFSQKDAHWFTDHFASSEMSVRIDFEGWTINILFAKYCLRCLRCQRCLRCLRCPRCRPLRCIVVTFVSMHIFETSKLTLFHKPKHVFRSTSCWGSPSLLAVIVLVIIVGFPLFGHPRENGYCRFRDFYQKTPFRQYLDKCFKNNSLDNTWNNIRHFF